MKEEKVSRLSLVTGKRNENDLNAIKSVFVNHNFVDTISALVRTSDLQKVSQYLPQNDETIGFTFESSLLHILSYILSLDEEIRRGLKLITSNIDVTHENSICVSHGKLTIKLRSDIYTKSGLKLKKSTFSQGNSRFNTQMYIGRFSLTDFETFIEKNDKNYIRLLWFAENVLLDTYHFQSTFENILTRNADDDIIHMKKQGITSVKPVKFVSNVQEMKKCISPDLTISNESESMTEILEWLSYASMGGPQLTLERNIDSYISKYPSMMDVENELNISLISIKKIFVPSSIITEVFENMYKSLEWGCLLTNGVKNIISAYSDNSEHSIISDGANDVITFCNGDDYVIWEIIDSDDSHKIGAIKGN